MRCLALVMTIVGVVACGSVPATPDAAAELCFDGADNDGNGLADCADPACDPTAVCVPSSAAQPAGVLVGENEPCPAGFDGGETVIHRGLQPGECVGCGCTPGTTTCVGHVWTYATSAACDADLSNTGGTEITTFVLTDSCSYDPTDGDPGNLLSNQLHGLRVNIEAQPTCAASGTASPGPSTWTTSRKFCRSSSAASGCAAGSACVARAATPEEQCAINPTAACAGDYASVQNDWYTGLDDQRTCGACECTASGGDCANVLAQIGSDYTCVNNGTVADDARYCVAGFGVYSPPAMLVGTSTPATACTASAVVTGGVGLTGQTTLCCGPQ